MAERDLDEQWADIVAHWDEEALGRDPHGDPTADATTDPTTDPSAGPTPDPPGDATGAAAGERPADAPPDPPVITSAPVARGPVGPVSTEPAGSLDHDGHDDHDDHDGLPAYWQDRDEREDHYVPPPPAPLPPSEDKHFWVMLGALVAGPCLFVYLLLFNRDGNGWWMLFGLLVTIAGFVLLVLRQPLERDEDDDGIRL